MFRKNELNDWQSLFSTPELTNVCYDFSGNKSQCKLSVKDLFKSKSLVLIGSLLELVCETPLEKNCDSMKLIKSSAKPIVASTDNGKYVLLISSDNSTLVASKNPSNLVKATKLHSDFHGTDPNKLKKINIDEDPKFLLFYGHLNNIVYEVPNYSGRYEGSQGLPSGTPFKHEGRDRGDEISKAREKPMVCVSPDREYAVIYGSQFYFGEKGLVG